MIFISPFLLIMLIIVLTSHFVIATWKRRHITQFSFKLPGPPALPIIGNALGFIGSPDSVMKNIVKTMNAYPSPFRFWVGSKLFVIIAEPEDLQIVLNSSKLLQKDEMYTFFKNTVGEGLFSAPVDKWRKHRRIINPAFNPIMLEQFIPTFNKKSQVLVEVLQKEAEKGEEFNLWPAFSSIALSLICETTMGYDLKTNKNDENSPEMEFARALEEASVQDSMRIYKPWLHPDVIFNLVNYIQGFDLIYSTLKKLPTIVINKKKEDFAQKKKQKLLGKTEMSESDELAAKSKIKVFVDILLEMNDAGAGFTDKDLQDHVITMMVGGSETSAITTCFCTLLLGMHPEIQEKVYKELYEIFGDSDRYATMEDLSKMVYLEQCLRETLRLFPPGPIFIREATDDISITNYTLPKGCSVLISPIKTHRLPHLYPNPNEFNPENFSEENVRNRHRYAFIPFSGGPRGCIGSKYAMLSMKTVMSTFLRSYRSESSIKLSDISLKIDLLARSKIGYPVKIFPRKQSVSAST